MAIQTESAFGTLFTIIAESAAARGDIAGQEWATHVAGESAAVAVRNLIDLLEIGSPRP